MTATNHALTGAVIGLVSGQAVVAIPAAIISHYICDAIPHFAAADSQAAIKSKLFKRYLILEAGLCFLVVLGLAIARPPHWELGALCAFLAASPDFLWINRYVKARQNQPWRPNAFSKLAARIQWFQRPIGWPVEAAWFSGMLVILIPIVFIN